MGKQIANVCLFIFQQYLPLSSKYSYKFVSHCKENDTIEFRVRGIETKKLIKEWIDVVGDLSHTQYKVWKTYKPQKDNTYRVCMWVFSRNKVYVIRVGIHSICYAIFLRKMSYTVFNSTTLKHY